MIPAAYLYLRVILNEEKKFRPRDVLHLLPAIFHLLELIPWYLHSSGFKREWLNNYLTDPDFVIQLREGLLPAYAHNLIRSVLAFSYLTAMIYIWRRNPSAKLKICKVMQLRTLWGPGIMLSLLVLVPLCITANMVIPHYSIGGTNMITAITGGIFLVMNFLLFSKPQLLYGLATVNVNRAPIQDSMLPKSPDLLLYKQESDTANVETDRQPNFEHLEIYQAKLEEILSAKPYLMKGYSLVDLSKDTGIPRHYLSALLNKVYGLRFNDFINQHRIRYISDNLHDSAWSNLTIEGIGNEAGFNSRTTFFYAIKKFTGLSPKEFLENSRKKNLITL
jgi:AraC-like DNA-binding protein